MSLHRTETMMALAALALTFACAWTELCPLAHGQGTLLAPIGDGGEDIAKQFRSHVEPILRKRCFSCHSHASGKMEGGLALDWQSGWAKGGGRGPAIIAGKPEESLLIRAIGHGDPELKMPEDKLPDNERALLVDWIRKGAFDDRAVLPSTSEATDWWSLKPLVRPAIPQPSFGEPLNPIDAFVLDRMQQESLAPSPSADRKTLVRRVYYDLIGLQPTPEEVDAFALDDHPQAYERLVARLLDSPQYGQRWARHWLDTIHFADSHGFEHDVGRDHAWPYRDYVIQSLNSDTPWPRFIREQLATDYFCADQSDLTPALGFLGAGTFDLSAFSTAPITFDYLDRDDLVTQTMSAFTSTTANCARCHSHKFDPIPQEDYYALQAVFAGIVKGDVAYDGDPSTGRRRRQLQSLIAAAKNCDEGVLFADEQLAITRSWLDQHTAATKWHPLQLKTFVSTDGATLSLSDDGILIASGLAPERDTYVITATTTLSQVTAIRLNLFAHQSLPAGGPGRCQNGNLHLSEIELVAFVPGSKQGRIVKIRSASADFNQEGWGVERAIDGDLKTAWGIHPAVGKPHHAVFELAEPLSLESGSHIAITLKQLHGRSHLIGACNLSATDCDGAKAAALPGDVEAALATPGDERTHAQRLTLAVYAVQRFAEEKMQSLPTAAMVYAAAPSVSIPNGNGKSTVHSLAKPKQIHLLLRGDFDKPVEPVSPGALSVLGHMPSRFSLHDPENESHRRAMLADWLAHEQNVLTWRSIVNRVWHYHFGRGLCDTPSDLGRMGGQPSHIELIDWLAVWFRDDAAGSLKKLHRLIVTSQTYRQSSATRADASRQDSENRLLWRQNRHRLDAEAVRDFSLVVSGKLDRTIGGPGIQHFTQSKGPQNTPELNYEAFDWNAPGAGRRSIYRYVWRGIADPFMESLDFPDLGLLAPTRGFSVSSLQALTLFNNDFILNQCLELSERVARESSDADEQIQRMVRLVWLRDANQVEMKEFKAFVASQSLPGLARVLLNSNEFLFVD